MCIAIYKNEDIVLYESTLKNCWDANDDGAGFMYTEKGKLYIEKGFFTFDEFMSAYDPHKAKQAVLHFRIKTHGKIDETNCHPFQIDENLGFVHNGTISAVDTPDNSKSDTWHFNEAILKPIRSRYKSFFKDDVYKRLLDNYIGWSKLIFLNSQGEYSIVNEMAGEWNSGCWFSNSSWKDTAVPTYAKPEPVVDDPIDYDPYNYKEREIYLESSKDKGSIISANDICWIKYDSGSLKTGDYVRVKYVYADNSVGVETLNDPKKEWRIPAYKLMKTSITTLYSKYATSVDEEEEKEEKPRPFSITDEVCFKQHWNHFRKYDKAVIHDVGLSASDPVVVTDPYTLKHYTVPVHLLELEIQ